jgi:glycosyltransferase involved in cell wall biosynthesis
MRWVTFFPNLRREHLTKDVGLLPFYMGKEGFQATLLTTGSGVKPADLPEEVGSLNLETLQDQGKHFFLEKSFISYLDDHAADIDVLHLFHFNRDTILYGLEYKKKNPKGFLYVKLDAYNQHLVARKVFSKNPVKDFFLQIRARKFHKAVDLLTIENTDGLNIAQKTHPEWKAKLLYLPNGCNDLYLESLEMNDSEKENIILSVGRLGSPDKNYELLLGALQYLDIPGWKLRIIGPISDDFAALIDHRKEAKPKLFEAVEFVGEMTNREALYHEYSRARVFFLPSKFESFGIAFVEALYFGNIVVGHSGMAAFDDLSAKGKFGEYFENNNPESLAESLKLGAHRSAEPGIEKRIRQHTRENFYWSSLARRLSSHIQND